jgi:predicted ester cyclase
MTKSTAIVATLLALLTGLVLGQLSSLAVPRLQSASFVSTVSAQDLATARAFYDEMNRFLATGDSGAESLLALDFVDYTGSLPSGRNAEQLMAVWSAIRSFLPDLQLEVVGLQASGAMIAVRLEVHPGTAPNIPGVPVTAPAASSVVEFLRIERAKVAERWSSDDRLPGLAMTLHADFDPTGRSLSGPVIQRLSLPAGQEVALSGDDTVVLRVISGELRFNRAAVDPQRVTHPTSDPIATGQTRIVDVSGTLLVRNLSPTTTEFLAFSLYGLYPVETPLANTATAVAPPGVEALALALAYLPLRLTGSSLDRLCLSVSEVTLPAGARVVPYTPGVVVEIVVLDGALEVSVQSGRALVSNGDGQMHPFDDVETVSAGQGFSASSIVTLSYRVAGAQPATLLIMTIEPAPSPETHEGA